MDEKVAIILANQLQKLYSTGFYKRKLDKAGVKPSDIKTLDDFKKIPFTTSSEYLTELKRRTSTTSAHAPKESHKNEFRKF